MTTDNTSPAVIDLDAMERTARDGADFCDCGALATAWCADSECGAYGCDAHQPAEYRGAHIRHDHRWAPNGTHAADVLRLVDEARRLTAANARLRAAAQAVIDGFLAMRDDLHNGADEAARVANAERTRDAFRALVAEVSK